MICFMGNKHENEKNEMMKEFAFSFVLSLLVSGVKPGNMRGRWLVGGIWKVKKELLWHSDRVGRFLLFFNLFDRLSSTPVPTITGPITQVGGGVFRLLR